MGHWGVKSYENDDAHDALDAAFERVHGQRYDALMDDANPLSFEQVQTELASPETLAAALAIHEEAFGPDSASWDEVGRLAYAGIVIRHAELGVEAPNLQRLRAIEFLETEEIDWDEEVKRRLRREKEIRLLRRPGGLAV
jgi:hypothetical protein